MTCALITGASSGIGYELARLFAKDKHDLILVSKDKKALVEKSKILNEEFKVKVIAIPKDLAKDSAAREIYDELKSKNIEVDFLVNNAGFGAVGKIQDNDYQNNAEMIGVNITSLTLLTQLFLKEMVQKKHGKILQVSSIAAYLPGEEMAVYYATKAYINSFSNSVNEELKKSRVSMTTLCPGPTATNFTKRAHMNFGNWKVMDAKKVALEGYVGFMKSKKIIIPGFRNKVIVAVSKILPNSWLASLMRKMD